MMVVRASRRREGTFGGVFADGGFPGGLQTGRAQTEQEQVVILQTETGGRKAGEIAGAAFDFVHTTATTAIEVVMMGLASEFIARGLVGKIDQH